MGDERTEQIRKGRYVETVSLIYNLIEVGVSLTAGFLTGSSALISWGVDSIVESNSAAFMIWRLHGEEKGISQREVLKRKKTALGVLSAAFTIAVLFICYEAISKFISGETASMSWWGIGILLVSLVVNPLLAWGKYHYGKLTDSPTLKYDAIDTMICEYQTIVVLVGIGLVQWQGWWWADPVAALLIVPYVAWEAFNAGRDAWQVDPSNNFEENRVNQSDIELRVHGMDCAEEVTLLKRELLPVVGSEERLGFDVLNAKLVIEPPAEVSRTEILAAIERTGLKAEPWRDEPQNRDELSFWQRNQRTILTAVSGLFGLAGLSVQLVAGQSESVPVAAIALYSIGIVAGMLMVLPKAWRSLVAFRPDMNLLMSVAVVGAVLIGEWFEGAAVAFLFSFSLLLESWSVGRARRAIASLMDLSPPTAHLRDDSGELNDVAPADVSVGSIVVVRPGEKIPLDGKVISGISGVNQAPITGESVPVEKEPRDEVFAGTINGDGLLEIETTKAADDTTLARIIKMVGDAGSKRAPSEKWVEKFAAVYTPAVMIVALLLLVIPPLAFGGEWADWLYRSLVLLVIACPCALVISTPVSVVASLAAAARNGVLIKGGVFVELPAQLKAIAMDKTGTLTLGEPSVIDVVPMNGHDEAELLTRAGALELNSNHPLARAIVEETKRRGMTIPAAERFETIQGKGASGVIDGKPFWLGSHRYLEERGQETPEVHEQLEAMQEAGRTVVVVGNDEHVCGFITLADAIREETRGAITQLHEAGVEKLVMLTGDNEGTAKAIAKEAGIDEVHAELLPEDKVAAVERLVEQHKFVAMIGDGVNDAPALARASLGLAMGAAGTDAAIETADIALMSDDLSKLPWLIHHSRRTLSIIRQNIAFSLAVKVLFVTLTFAGFASLWAAIAADMGASLLVIGNGLRLLRETGS